MYVVTKLAAKHHIWFSNQKTDICQSFFEAVTFEKQHLRYAIVKPGIAFMSKTSRVPTAMTIYG